MSRVVRCRGGVGLSAMCVVRSCGQLEGTCDLSSVVGVCEVGAGVSVVRGVESGCGVGPMLKLGLCNGCEGRTWVRGVVSRPRCVWVSVRVWCGSQAEMECGPLVVRVGTGTRVRVRFRT